MDRATIERILKEQGCTASFKDRVWQGGTGRSNTYVYARKRGYHAKSLGPVRKVEAMSEEQLIAKLLEKFPKKVEAAHA